MPLVTALWIAANVANASVLCAMTWARAFRRWPSLFALLCLVSAQTVFDCSVVLMGAYRLPLAFYGHYGFAVAMDAAEVWLIAQMALALAGVTPRLRRWIRRAVPAICSVTLCGTAAVTFTDGEPWFQSIQQFAARFDVAVSLAWATSFLCLPLVAKFFEVQWSGGVRPVAIGFLVEAMGTAVTSYVAYGTVTSIHLAEIKCVTYLLTLTLWSSVAAPQGATWARRLLSLYPHPAMRPEET